MSHICFSQDSMPIAWGHPLNAYARLSEKLTFLTPWHAHVCVRIRGLEVSVFRKILRTYLMGSSLWNCLLSKSWTNYLAYLIIKGRPQELQHEWRKTQKKCLIQNLLYCFSTNVNCFPVTLFSYKIYTFFWY